MKSRKTESFLVSSVLHLCLINNLVLSVLYVSYPRPMQLSFVSTFINKNFREFLCDKKKQPFEM